MKIIVTGNQVRNSLDEPQVKIIQRNYVRGNSMRVVGELLLGPHGRGEDGACSGLLLDGAGAGDWAGGGNSAVAQYKISMAFQWLD